MRLTRICQISTLTATMLAMIGCGRTENPRPTTTPPTLSVPSVAETSKPQIDLNQPFSKAVIEEDPGNQQPPTDVTIAGRTTAQVRVAVQKLWDGIRFQTATGKPIEYYAKFDTEYGDIRVKLLPEFAPNHVRNFVALARAGYYDNLVFEQVIQIPGDGTPDSGLELIEGGCPVGTGEQGLGHLGYWLKPEFHDSIKHEAGILGACHDERLDTAACRFYMTLRPAPMLDGQFTAYGRVVSGMDVIRTISKRSYSDGNGPPVKPASIRAVVIEMQDAP